MLVQEIEDRKASFDTKNKPKDLNEAETNSEVKKHILATLVPWLATTVTFKNTAT